MEIQEIFEIWQPKCENKQAVVELWNSMAEKYGGDERVTFENDKFLRLLRRESMFDKSYSVLDVGCGIGRYSLALAPLCNSITGIDLSDKMLGRAREEAEIAGIENVSFHLADWININIEEYGWKDKFDLVFARMTPAVQSAGSFQKLNNASRGWCVLSKPTRRVDPVSDNVKSLVGIKEKRESADDDIVYSFELLWRQGYFPHVEYDDQTWDMRKTLDEAYGLYINRVKTYREITAGEEEKIKSYLRSIAINDMINEKVTTTITTIYWNK